MGLEKTSYHYARGSILSPHPCTLAKVKRVPGTKKLIGASKDFLRMLTVETPRLARVIHRFFKKEATRIAKVAVKEADLTQVAKATTKSRAQQIADEINLEGWAVLTDQMTPKLAKAFRKAGVRSIQALGVETEDALQHLDKLALEYAEKRAAQLVGKGGGRWSVTESTRKGIRDLVADAIEAGTSADSLARDIRDSYEFSFSRATTIARTELATAHMQGNLAGWKESGVVEMKQSVLGSEHDMDDDCDDAASDGAIPMEDDFSNGMFAPPYHPNCICDLVPIIPDPEDEKGGKK